MGKKDNKNLRCAIAGQHEPSWAIYDGVGGGGQ